MEQKSVFKRIERSETRMYGQRGLLVCGCPEEERDKFLDFISALDMEYLPVIFAGNMDIEKSVGELLTLKHKNGLTGSSELPRSVIMSGLSQGELHMLMESYRETGFVRQIWASLTPVNETWTLKALLIELLKEARAMNKQ